MTLGPVRVMGAGVVAMLCAEEVDLYNVESRDAFIVKQFTVHHLMNLIME